MKSYQYTLRVFAVAIWAIALVHIAFGVYSETFLGSGISQTSVSDPNLDSQNRFYGAAFSIYGVVLWLSSSNPERYSVILEWSLLVFFLAGLTRLLSITLVGMPTTTIIGLTAIELVTPPLLYFWKRRLQVE